MRTLTALAAGLAFCGSAQGVNAQGTKAGRTSYGYDKPVTLTGMLRYVAFPNAPGYAGDPKGQHTEHDYFLTLSRPIAVAKGDEFSPAEPRVTALQLGTATVSFAKMRQLARAKARVQVTGKLFHSTTVYHHTPVLMDVSAIAAAKTGGKRTR